MSNSNLPALLAWFEQLQPASLSQLSQFYHEQACFQDPFNQLHGLTAIARVFEHMFTHTEQPRFVIHQSLQQGERAFVTWDFHYRWRGRAYCIQGGTYFEFAEDGRVLLHQDYWDAAQQLWQKLPIIGAPIRWLRSKFVLR